MDKIRFSLLRGVCQTPAYVAHEKGFFRDQGIDTELGILATAWLVPHKLSSGESEFALLPWTRSATADRDEARLMVVCGSGHEEAAIVMRRGLSPEQVRRVVVPLRGGMKDLTAMGLIRSLGWEDAILMRQPSGDGAIISFFGEGADAASMVEPYASMLEALNIGSVIKRTGDIWPGAPGCSLTTTAQIVSESPDLVQRTVNAFARGVRFVKSNPKESAEIAHPYIGVHPKFIERAFEANLPEMNTIRNDAIMQQILGLMKDLGYIDSIPTDFCDTRFLEHANEYLEGVS